MFPTPIAKASAPARLAYRLLLPVSLVCWLLPLIGVLMTSVRPLGDLAAGNYFGLPSRIDFTENYGALFSSSPIGHYLLNSLLITLPSVAGAIALACLAGFALSTYRFRGNLFIFFLFVAGNFVPFQILMVPVRDLALRLGVYDSILGLVLFHTAFQTGFCTLFMRNFMRQLPYALIEAARIEGVSEIRIFIHVVLPLVRPAIAALSVLVFTFVWNDYFWAMVMVQGEHAMPVTAGLYALKGQWIAAWNLIAGGAVVAALPPAAIFFLMQRHFIAGLTLGATKG
ncbi:sugar ABC transporter permease [Rhizobium sp. Root1203]|uniref:carbohydrate ABC transporter permease n=1 Tax=Rhizobium sp. Root1203 TaxID=1736427 RepID=UPI000709ADA4|nr:carbohydrate ABC transporter permease [Rhizobium sp. Root1203]KQV27177.1 sugar ABC transporter permease [Rhizobium sp. Root1203]